MSDDDTLRHDTCGRRAACAVLLAAAATPAVLAQRSVPMRLRVALAFALCSGLMAQAQIVYREVTATGNGGDPGEAGNKNWLGSWADPLLRRVGDHDELIMSYPGRVCAFEPLSGSERWTCTSGRASRPVRTRRKQSMPGCGTRLHPIEPRSSFPSRKRSSPKSQLKQATD